ncbi:NAD-dependent epimerase/dehydratase family protein [Chaetoceros tenuissimus]|uniref:NAD-dependent epimerase/dehydratase family protein n=1 Tax=Chaetoceros tenuissimus TaxID=426638 RepID=A0AAD3HCH9_9STRA|nr:NAD-dependent epimerase/dehydratase family protein [Chaetoceros tenuissimus]GFH58068.1 NAD-dependent epimerase/dehydratase family protein [Chaetoceros tenuissimus]
MRDGDRRSRFCRLSYCRGPSPGWYKVVVYDIFNGETTPVTEKEDNARLLAEVAEMFSKDGASLQVIRGDIRDKEKIIEVISNYGVTSCIHVAAMVDDRRSVFHPDEYIDVNVRGTAMLLDALGSCGVKVVIQASTRSVFGQRADNGVYLTEKADRRPVNPYGASKVGADAMAHSYSHLHKINLTLVRIFATYGPRGRPDMIPRILIENIVNDKPIRKFGDGSATRTWIYISDIAAAFITALRNPSKGFAEFNTGAPNSTTLNELIACAEKVTGKKAIIEHFPVPPGDAHTVGHPSYDLIQSTLGWSPKVSVEEGMRLTHLDYMEKKRKVADTDNEEEKKDDF